MVTMLFPLEKQMTGLQVVYYELVTTDNVTTYRLLSWHKSTKSAQRHSHTLLDVRVQNRLSVIMQVKITLSN